MLKKTDAPFDAEGVTGQELIDKIGEYPTLDTFLDRDPHAEPLSATELADLVGTLRGQRAAFIAAQEKKASKEE